MLISFQDQYQGVQVLTKLTDATSAAKFKRDVNIGGSKFMSVVGRGPARVSRFADLVAYNATTGAGQYYQIPKDADKPKEVIAYNGTIWTPLIEIVDEAQWKRLNITVLTGPATHYFVRGSDEIGLYPAPAANQVGGLELVFEKRQLKMTQDDFTTGTVAITNGTTTLTHSATGFTAQMVGRGFEVTDGSDNNWYRIASFTSTSVVTLDNVYQGLTVTAATFRIGEVMDIPEEYLEGPIDYAMWRYELGHDITKATTFEQNFKESLNDCKSEYGRKSASSIVNASGPARYYDPLRGTPTTIGS